MRRSKGTHKLETVKIDGIGEADIYIELDKGQFYYYPAKFADRVLCDTLKIARENVLAMLARRGHLNWQEVIEIQTGRHTEGNVTLDYERFRIAKREDGHWLKVDWDEKPDDRIVRGREFHVHWEWAYQKITVPMHLFPKKENSDNPYHLVPYSAELWAGLEIISKKLSELGKKIDALLDSEKGRKLIEENASKLLVEKI